MYASARAIAFISVKCSMYWKSFCKMKLIKTRLRNKLSQVLLDSLICISTEAPDEFSDTEYEFFVDKLQRLNSYMRIDLYLKWLLFWL